MGQRVKLYLNQGKTDIVEIEGPGCCILPILFNLYGEYLMKQALAKVRNFKIVLKSINEVRFADDTAIIAKTQEELHNMLNRLVDTERKYGMEINIDKSLVMRVSRSNELMQIKVNNRELKEIDHFKYLGGVLTRGDYCTKEIKMRITISKEAFNRKKSLLRSKINIELKKKLVRCYVWSMALYGSETCTLRKLESIWRALKRGAGGE